MNTLKVELIPNPRYAGGNGKIMADVLKNANDVQHRVIVGKTCEGMSFFMNGLHEQLAVNR